MKPFEYPNNVGPRTFEFSAGLDILGWRFTTYPDGSLQIETPATKYGGALMFYAANGNRALLAALLSASDDVKSVPVEVEKYNSNIGHSERVGY